MLKEKSYRLFFPRSHQRNIPLMSRSLSNESFHKIPLESTSSIVLSHAFSRVVHNDAQTFRSTLRGSFASSRSTPRAAGVSLIKCSRGSSQSTQSETLGHFCRTRRGTTRIHIGEQCGHITVKTYAVVSSLFLSSKDITSKMHVAQSSSGSHLLHTFFNIILLVVD